MGPQQEAESLGNEGGVEGGPSACSKTKFGDRSERTGRGEDPRSAPRAEVCFLTLVQGFLFLFVSVNLGNTAVEKFCCPK